MKLYRLKWYEILIFIGAFSIDYLFTVTQKYYIPENIRPFSLLFITIVLLIIFFYIVKPEKPFALSGLLSLVLGIAVAVIIVIIHMIITFDLSYKQVIIFLVAVGSPYLSGWFYQLFNKRDS